MACSIMVKVATLYRVFTSVLLMSRATSFSYPCIPVMGFGFIQDPKNFTARLITSVDFCVETFVVIYSEKYFHETTSRLQFPELSKSWFDYSRIKNVKFVAMPTSLIGVAEGWNLILKSADAPWYLISAYDVEFFPGQLESFSRRFWVDTGQHADVTGIIGPAQVKINFVHTKWQNLPGGRGFNLFGVSRDVVSHCGYFDENIFPAFWEDRDYQYRMSLWNGSKIGTYRNIRPWHGERFTEPLLAPDMIKPDSFKKQFNYTSGTVYLSSNWRIAMKKASESNVQYVVSKWGCDMQLAKTRHHLLNCIYTTPFNKGAPISHWKRDEHRLNIVRNLYGSYV